MRLLRLLVVPVALVAVGCFPGAVDYSALRSAAEARQRSAGSALAPSNATVQGLLSRPLSAEAAAQVALLNNTGVRAAVEEPGDWALHCHMTHHVMNQMGHGIPNMVGVDTKGLDQKARKLLPAYMSMGQTGMDMSEHPMPAPKNSIPMVGGQGKHDYLTMGGRFTILKVRDQLTSYEDPGWYENPAGTLARASVAADLQRDGVDPKGPPQGDASDAVRWG